MVLKITGIVGTIERIIGKKPKYQIFGKSGEILTVFREKWPFFTKSVIFSKLVFLCFLPGFWTLMLKFYRIVGIHILYKVTEGICEKGLCSWDTHIFIRKKWFLVIFGYKKACISGTNAFYKNSLCNFVENLNAYNPVKFQYQGPKNQGENIKKTSYEKITLFVKNGHFSRKTVKNSTDFPKIWYFGFFL